MKSYSIIAGIALALLASACNQKEAAYRGLEKVTYTPTDEIFANPERGLYSGGSYDSEAGRALSQGVLKSARTAGRTLYMLEFWLKPFFESDISEGYLNLIRQSLEAYRGTGVKCILRFGYSDNIKDLSHPENDAPFDASEEQVLRHIAQLKPVLQEYSDVIYVLQAGFIGCWGEWYYTTNFNGADMQARKHVVDALLDALPGDKQIELRTPAYKMKLYGYALADTINRAEAHLPTTKARLGGHNDCFLAGANDQGTFQGSADRQYWSAETNYTIMGGETCAMSKYCECDNALKVMAAQHYSYLNMSYNHSVLNYWARNDCYDEIKARLGYRLALTNAYFTKKPSSGSPMRVALHIDNKGFASVMNPRDAELVLTDKLGRDVASWPLESDPRYWMAGTTTVVDQTIDLPSGLSGTYTLWLNLPDPSSYYQDNPLYSIRLANDGIWDEETGYNKLHIITL